MQDGGLGDARGHRDGRLAQHAEHARGIEPADAVPAEQPGDGRLAQARRLGRGRGRGPERQDPFGRDVVAQLEQLRVVAPELLADAVGQAHALLLQLLGQARPLAQLDHARVADGHAPEQVRVGAQPGGRDPGVAPVVLGPGDADPVAQAVELLGVVACTAKPRSSSASTTGPCGTSIAAATAPASPATDTSQSQSAARPAASCRNARSPTTAPAPSSRQTWCFSEPQSTPANQRLASPVMALVLPCRTSHRDGLPVPVLALKGATSYWASAVANSPGHMSHLGARGTGGRWSLPTGRPAWSAYDLADQTSLEGTGWTAPNGIGVPRCGRVNSHRGSRPRRALP